MIMFQRSAVWIYFGVFFGLLLLGLARVLFADDSTFGKRMTDFLAALIPFVLWPLAIFVPRSQRIIKDAMPFRQFRRFP
jgi:hypothetical protein